MRRVCTLAAALLLCVPLAGESGWISLRSPHFELLADAREQDARSVLAFFEQVRDFFMRVKSQSVTTRLPVTILLFRSPTGFAPYRPSDAAGAYYTGDEQRDFIVLGSAGPDILPTALHEYMHLLVRHSGLKFPLWLDEGFAEVYSTLQPGRGQVILGNVPRGRAQRLASERWVPLAELLEVTPESPQYNEKDRAGIFYAQSWLLAHMLMLGAEYRDGFQRFVTALDATASAEDAFESVYGKKLWEVEYDLNLYFKAKSLNGLSYKTRFENIKVDRSRAAEAVEVDIALAKVLALIGRYDEAKRRFADLAKTYTRNADVQEALGHLNWRADGRDAALKHFARAIEFGSTNWKLYWDYARLLGPGADEKAYADAVRKVLQFKPEMIEARLALGHSLVRQRDWQQALSELKTIQAINPARAAELLLLKAYCALRLDLPAEAKNYVSQAREHAKDPERRKELERMTVVLERSGAEAQIAESTIPMGEDPAYQVPSWSPLRRTSMTGNFKRLDCLEGIARMHVMDGRDTVTLMIRNPQSIRVSGVELDALMKCGPRNEAVVVHYLPSKDERFGTVGEVREVRFDETTR